MVNIIVMKNIRNLFNIHPATYFLILSFLFTGLIKNIILIYIIVIFHELGHITVAKIFHYQALKVDIYPMGGITKFDKKINSNLRHELLIAIAGVLFQIILFLIFYVLKNTNLISLNTYSLFLNYNKTILLFNMIPIIPLDGYIFLRSIWELIFPYKKAFYISLIISVLSIIFFITFNELFSLNNYLIISFLIYKIIIEIKNFKYTNLRFQMERYLYPFSYRKIEHDKEINLDLLKKDTYHYFKDKDKVYSEKTILMQKFR